jgi:hypothetical protein
MREGYAMPQPTTRDRIIEALQELPPDATFDDAIERLIFLAKIEAGLTQLDAGKGVPHDEVKRRLKPATALIWSPQSLGDLESIRALHRRRLAVVRGSRGLP